MQKFTNQFDLVHWGVSTSKSKNRIFYKTKSHFLKCWKIVIPKWMCHQITKSLSSLLFLQPQQSQIQSNESNMLINMSWSIARMARWIGANRFTNDRMVNITNTTKFGRVHLKWLHSILISRMVRKLSLQPVMKKTGIPIYEIIPRSLKTVLPNSIIHVLWGAVGVTTHSPQQ